jgi:hypothetical protein
MPDDNKVAAVTDCPDDGVGVLRPTCRIVLARDDEVPVPGASAAAMDERERRHGQRSPLGNRVTAIDARTL